MRLLCVWDAPGVLAEEVIVANTTYDIPDEIVVLAGQLDNNPALIYVYVRDEVEYTPYYGLMKGGLWTMWEGGGNDMDQAALLSDLLRASGYETRFVIGTVEVEPEYMKLVLGVNTTEEALTLLWENYVPAELSDRKILVEHTWVEARLPYGAYSGDCYRGYIAERSSCGGAPLRWVPLDASFVPYVAGEPYPIADVGFDLNATIVDLTRNATTTQDYFTGLDYTAVEGRIEGFLNQTREGYIADVVGQGLAGEPIFPSEEVPEIIPGTLPFHMIASEVYQDVPLEFRVLVKVSLERDGESILTSIFDLTEIDTEQVLLVFEAATKGDVDIVEASGGLLDAPAYLVDLRPQLWLGGKIITLSSEPVTPGESLELVYEVYTPGGMERAVRVLHAGGIHALVSAPGGVPSELLERHVNATWGTYTSLAGNTTTRDALGGVLYLMGSSYFGNMDMFTDAAARQNSVRVWRPTPGFAVVSYYPYVDYIGSIPTTIRAGQPQIDVKLNVFSISSHNPGITKEFFMAYLAAFSSEMEGSLFQAYDTEGVTAAGIIRDANIQNIPVYVVSSGNLERVLPELMVSENVKERIRNAVRQGYRVMIPERAMSYGNWTGSDWVEYDPSTNAAGYMITDDLGAIMHGSRPKEDIPIGSVWDTKRSRTVKDEDGDGRDDATGWRITDIDDPVVAEEVGIINPPATGILDQETADRLGISPSSSGVLNPVTALAAGIDFEVGVLGKLDDISYRLTRNANRIREEKLAPAAFRLLLDPADEAAKAEWDDAFRAVKNLEDEAAWASRNIRGGAKLAKGLAVLGAGIEVYDVGSKVKKLHEEGRYNEAGAEILAGGGRIAGGIVGAETGAAIGVYACVAGPVGCAIGIGAGAIIGGIGGAMLGEAFMKRIVHPRLGGLF
jgi:hypothetical protein